MKKFNVSENLTIATSQDFKNQIRFAVENTEISHQYMSKQFEKKFIGTIVTFNPTLQKVQCFDLRSYADSSDKHEVAETLAETLAFKIQNQAEYAQNEFITFIEANDFEYHGYVGYASEQEQQIRTMKIENKFMALYIDILTKVNEDNTPIEDLNLSIRTTNCLKRANIKTVQEIKAMSMEDVMRIRNLGRNSYNELERVLNITFA